MCNIFYNKYFYNHLIWWKNAILVESHLENIKTAKSTDQQPHMSWFPELTAYMQYDLEGQDILENGGLYYNNESSKHQLQTVFFSISP